MKKQKIALVTGGTGGIGGEFVRFLVGLGYFVFTPVRARSEQNAFDLWGDNMHVTFEVCDLESEEGVFKYIEKMAKEGITFDLVVLAAGRFKWDNEFEGVTEKERQKNSISALNKDNFLTKVTVIHALKKVYEEKLKNTDIWIVSSQAAKFEEDNPLRLNEETGYTQEGYFFSMESTSSFAKRSAIVGLFNRVVLLEPDLIDTPGARKEFNKKTIGHDPDWDKIQKPKEYVSMVAKEYELKAA